MNHLDQKRIERLITPLVPSGPLQIGMIGKGKHGRAFTVQPRDGGSLAGEPTLVVKLYDSAAISAPPARQHGAMNALRQHIEGKFSKRWQLRAPRPLLWSDDPPALVSTWIPGKPLSALIGQRPGPSQRLVDELAGVIIDGLDRYWARTGDLYGDLHIDNLLCDPDQRMLGFIDAGVELNDTWNASTALDRWYPASRDLGYQLFNNAASLKRYLHRPAAWAGGMRMSEALVRCFAQRVADPDEHQALLEEIRQCAEVHLDSFDIPASPAGAWRKVVRRTARGWIHHTLARCRESAPNRIDNPRREVGLAGEMSRS